MARAVHNGDFCRAVRVGQHSAGHEGEDGLLARLVGLIQHRITRARGVVLMRILGAAGYLPILLAYGGVLSGPLCSSKGGLLRTHLSDHAGALALHLLVCGMSDTHGAFSVVPSPTFGRSLIEHSLIGGLQGVPPSDSRGPGSTAMMREQRSCVACQCSSRCRGLDCAA